MKAARIPTISYANAIKRTQLIILPKVFPEQVDTCEEQKIIGDLIDMEMWEEWGDYSPHIVRLKGNRTVNVC